MKSLSKELKKRCVICGREFTGWGNNAEPVKKGLCCDTCNDNIVIPARFSNKPKKIKR